MPAGSSGPVNSIEFISLNIVSLVIKTCHRISFEQKTSEAGLCDVFGI
jgi:hypothetical protein